MYVCMYVLYVCIVCIVCIVCFDVCIVSMQQGFSQVNDHGTNSNGGQICTYVVPQLSIKHMQCSDVCGIIGVPYLLEYRSHPKKAD